MFPFILIDEDYTVNFAEGVPANVWFKPGTHRVALPISIAEDEIPEIYEQFQLFVSGTPNGPPVTIPDDRDNAIITIADNDGTYMSNLFNKNVLSVCIKSLLSLILFLMLI